MYDGKRALVKKGVLPRTRATRFQRARAVDPVMGSEWRIQLPNGVAVAFTGSVDAATLTAVLITSLLGQIGRVPLNKTADDRVVR